MKGSGWGRLIGMALASVLLSALGFVLLAVALWWDRRPVTDGRLQEALTEWVLAEVRPGRRPGRGPDVAVSELVVATALLPLCPPRAR